MCNLKKKSKQNRGNLVRQIGISKLIENKIGNQYYEIVGGIHFENGTSTTKRNQLF